MVWLANWTGKCEAIKSLKRRQFWSVAIEKLKLFLRPVLKRRVEIHTSEVSRN